MNKPDFIIIGAAKSGTTSLYKYLELHPDIYLTRPKEPDFFSIDEHYNKGFGYYQSLFKQAQPHQICGEASTTYSRLQRYPQTLSRMAQHLPSVKFIYIMRHPVDRAYSFYSYRLKGSRINPKIAIARNELMTAKTFEEAIEQTSEFIDSSFYLYQIEQYLEHYPLESFLFLLMDDLISHPEKTITKIFNFLEVDIPANFFSGQKIIVNTRKDLPESYIKKQLKTKFFNNQFFKLSLSLIPKNIKNIIYQKWKNSNYEKWRQEQNQDLLPPPMLLETRKMLLKKFEQPNQILAEFLNKDLSHWNK